MGNVLTMCCGTEHKKHAAVNENRKQDAGPPAPVQLRCKKQLEKVHALYDGDVVLLADFFTDGNVCKTGGKAYFSASVICGAFDLDPEEFVASQQTSNPKCTVEQLFTASTRIFPGVGDTISLFTGRKKSAFVFVVGFCDCILLTVLENHQEVIAPQRKEVIAKLGKKNTACEWFSIEKDSGEDENYDEVDCPAWGLFGAFWHSVNTVLSTHQYLVISAHANFGSSGRCFKFRVIFVLRSTFYSF